MEATGESLEVDFGRRIGKRICDGVNIATSRTRGELSVWQEFQPADLQCDTGRDG